MYVISKICLQVAHSSKQHKGFQPILVEYRRLLRRSQTYAWANAIFSVQNNLLQLAPAATGDAHWLCAGTRDAGQLPLPQPPHVRGQTGPAAALLRHVRARRTSGNPRIIYRMHFLRVSQVSSDIESERRSQGNERETLVFLYILFPWHVCILKHWVCWKMTMKSIYCVCSWNCN